MWVGICREHTLTDLNGTDAQVPGRRLALQPQVTSLLSTLVPQHAQDMGPQGLAGPPSFKSATFSSWKQ